MLEIFITLHSLPSAYPYSINSYILANLMQIISLHFLNATGSLDIHIRLQIITSTNKTITPATHQPITDKFFE